MSCPLAQLADTVEKPAFRALIRHWLEQVAALGRLPRLADIDPLQLAPALAHVWVVDAAGDGDFRFHLCGESVARWYGRNPKGACYSDFFERPLAQQSAQYARRVLDGPQAMYLRMSARVPDWSTPLPLERLAFPLAAPDGSISRILGASVFSEQILNGTVGIALTPEEERWFPLPAELAA